MKSHILAEIKRIAAEHPGRLSYRTFVALTGIPETNFKGRYWASWSEALSEAGLAANAFSSPKTDESVIIAALASLTKRLGAWPTEPQLILERNGNPAFPSISVFRRLGKEVSLPAKVAAYCGDNADLAAVRAIAKSKAAALTEGSENAPAVAVAGYVYMMRSGKRYKIGRSNSPSRRFREVRLDLPDETLLVHTIPTDDPSGIESYWHRRFASKRVRDTEFFELAASDVTAFKRRKYQ